MAHPIYVGVILALWGPKVEECKINASVNPIDASKTIGI
jgi:hypothetical protein